MKNIKKKKALVTIIIGIICISIGGTFAYYTSSATFDNEFVTAEYKTVAEEVFESPTNWKPGDTTEKTVTVTNEGDINARVRVCITDTWLAKDGTTELPNHDTTQDIDIAVINPANTSDWVVNQVDGCYYYLDELEPNETTSSPIESVTFNSAYTGDVSCTKVGNVITCESGDSGYDGATYTLTLSAQTVQSEGLSEWGIGYYSLFDSTGGSSPTTFANSESAIGAVGYNTFLRTTLGNNGFVYQVGFRMAGTDYYLTARDTSAYEANKIVLNTAFGQANCEERTGNVQSYNCETEEFEATVSDVGFVEVTNFKGENYFTCVGDEECHETRVRYSDGTIEYDTPEEAMEASNALVYLKYLKTGDTIIQKSVGFKVGDNLYYLVGGDEGASYEANKAVLDSAFGASNCTETTTSYTKYECSNEYYEKVYADNTGVVYATERASGWRCHVNDDVYSGCYYFNVS